MIALRFVLLCGLFVALLAPAARADSASWNSDDLKAAKEWNAAAERYMNQGEYEEARRLYLRTLPVMEKALGQEHPATVTTLGNLCDASIRMSAYLDAKPLCMRALALREKVLGPSHPDVARSLSDLGLLYANEGDLGRAESLLRRALRIDSAEANSPDMPTLLNNFGFLYSKKGKYARAEEYFDRAIAATEEISGREAPALVTMYSNAANVYLANHKFGDAAERFRHALAIAEHLSGPEQVASVRPLLGLARAEAALGNGSKAQTFLQRAESLVEHDRQAYLEWRAPIQAARLSLMPK